MKMIIYMFPLERMIRGMDLNGIEKTALVARMCEPFYMDATFKKLSSRTLRMSLLYLNPLGKMVYTSTIDSGGNFVLNPLTRETYKIYGKPDNNEVVEVIDKYPDRFYGWIFVNPAGPSDPMEEIRKYVSIPQMIS